MTRIKELTTAQFTQLLDAYFAPPKKRSKMTIQEIKEIAEQLNQKINIPLINETREEKILIKIVLKVDRFLYDHLPNEFYELIRNVAVGIDDDEAKRLVKSLSRLANKHLDIPIIPERMEYKAIRYVIGILINAARKQWNLDRAHVALEKVALPAAKYAKASQLEQIIQ